MTSLDLVQQQLAAFLGGGAYEPLWEAVMNAADSIDDDPTITDDDREWFDELYDAVYMADEDPIDAAGKREGIIGAAELRVQLREMRLG